MEPFGIATSVLQVADTGFSLAKNLYQYAHDVKNAKSEVHNIAKEIDITSDVLRNFGNILKDENAKALCSPQLQLDAQRTLEECRAAFDDLNKTLVPFCKPDARGAIVARARFHWPVGKGKTKAHQERLERLKTSLSLMLEIIRYAKDSKSITVPHDPLLHAERHQIESLVRSNEALIRSLTSSNADYSDPTVSHKAISPDLCYGAGSQELALFHEQPRSLFSQSSSMAGLEDDLVSRQLRTCIDAAANVTQSLNSALTEWFASRALPQQKFQDSLQQLCLRVFDLEALLRNTEPHTMPPAQVQIPNPQHHHPPMASLPLAPPHLFPNQQNEARRFFGPDMIYEYHASAFASQYATAVPPIETTNNDSLHEAQNFQLERAAHDSHSGKAARRQPRGGRTVGRPKKAGDDATSNRLNSASETERRSFQDALDASRAVVSMIQSNAELARVIPSDSLGMYAYLPNPPHFSQRQPSTTPTLSSQPPENQSQSLPTQQPRPLLVHANTQSTFTPIDESSSMLAQYSSSTGHEGPTKSEFLSAGGECSRDVSCRQRNSVGANVYGAGRPAETESQDVTIYLNQSAPCFGHPSAGDGLTDWNSEEAVQYYTSPQPQGTSTGDVRHSPSEPHSIPESNAIELGSNLGYRKRRKEPSQVPVAKKGRRDCSKQLQPVQESEYDKNEPDSTASFDAAKSLEILLDRWINLSPETLGRTAAVA